MIGRSCWQWGYCAEHHTDSRRNGRYQNEHQQAYCMKDSSFPLPGSGSCEIISFYPFIFNKPTPRTKVRGFRAADIIWLLHDRCSRTYLRMTSSFTVPTVSAKYPSAQKLSPHKNSSSSGYSFRITLLVPPLSFWIAPAKLSASLSWMII